MDFHYHFLNHDTEHHVLDSHIAPNVVGVLEVASLAHPFRNLYDPHHGPPSYNLDDDVQPLNQALIPTNTENIMDIPTKMELVWKSKLITRLIGGWLDICVLNMDM